MHLYIKENILHFQEHKQGKNSFTYLQANNTHSTSIQGKKKEEKHTPTSTYKQKHTYILIKKCVHIPDQEEPKEIHR
jgi:hypothetical protein